MKHITFILGVAALLGHSTQLLGQPFLTGVEVFTADSSGNPTGGFVWNTVADDSIPNAWLDSGNSTLNGPTDSLVPVMIAIPGSLSSSAGMPGGYYLNIRNDYTVNPSYIGLSLWFNSSATPQISVFGSTSGWGHSPRPGFSDTFTDGTWTVRIGVEGMGSLFWHVPGPGDNVDVTGPFSVGSNGIQDAGLGVDLSVTGIPEPSIFLLSALGSFVLLRLKCLAARHGWSRSQYPERRFVLNHSVYPLTIKKTT